MSTKAKRLLTASKEIMARHTLLRAKMEDKFQGSNGDDFDNGNS
jgi:hypothetical protein